MGKFERSSNIAFIEALGYTARPLLNSIMLLGPSLPYIRALLPVVVPGEADLGLGLSGLLMISGLSLLRY